MCSILAQNVFLPHRSEGANGSIRRSAYRNSFRRGQRSGSLLRVHVLPRQNHPQQFPSISNSPIRGLLLSTTKLQSEKKPWEIKTTISKEDHEIETTPNAQFTIFEMAIHTWAIEHHFDEPLIRTSVTEVYVISNILLCAPKPLEVDNEVARRTKSKE
ncbi:hypothetical protein YC2023_033377 [Brassica napus]